MAITHSAATRNTLASAILASLEAGPAAAKLKLQGSGGVPEIAVITLDDPVGSVTGPVLTLTGFPKQVTVANSGTLAVFDATDSNNNVVFSGTITQNGGGGDMQLVSSSPGDLAVTAGNDVALNSGTYTASP